MNKFQSIMNPTFLNVEGLTFLYGPNSAGKSTVLDALTLLKDISTGFPKGGGLADFEGFTNNQNDGYDVSVGLEFIVGNIEFDHVDKNIQQWRDILESKYSTEIFDFHVAIIGKKVQIEIGDLGVSFKVAIDGVPLFEFMGSDEEPSELYSDEGGICGEVKINKKNKWFESLYISAPGGTARSKIDNKNTEDIKESSFHHRAIVKNSDDFLVVKGIGFSLSPAANGHVSVHQSVVDTLFFDYDKNQTNKATVGKKGAAFLFDNYSKDSPNYDANQKIRRGLYFDLESFAENLDLIIDGFFFQMNLALRYSHVLGDRKVINSQKPIGIVGSGKVEMCIESHTNYLHLKNYAEYLANLESDYNFVYPTPVIKNDFINLSLNSYLHSMKGYKIVSESYKVTRSNANVNGTQASGIYFLNVQNPKMHVLGFQDVGSGLSFIMPILTSLWNHDFSIIEQPELHLHPKAQCEMGDVFISAFKKGAVALVESHSEHLLLRILRRIRETTKGIPISKELKIKAEDLSIYYFEPVEQGHTIVRKIRVDRHGELLDLWPGGFFAERDDELFS